MPDPLNLIRTVIKREMNTTLGETYIARKAASFGSPEQLQDNAGLTSIDSFVSEDQIDRWFFMGISTWGSSNNIVSE